jgi:MFS family permease
MTTSEPGTGPNRRDQARKAGQALGHSLGTGARGTGRAVAATARVTGRFSRFTLRQARRAANAEGADKSGLSRLIEMHTFNTAGDAAVAISLAGTLFFQVPTGEARGQVALFLGLTMLPFAIVAPLLGPFLDRFSHGRRWAIGATMAIRAFMVWGLATAVTTESTWLFPLALGCLVSSKAYGVTRAAAVPRLLPENLTLVKANSRLSLAGVVGATVSAPIAGVASAFGAEWSLRYAFVLFILATIWAIRLPAQVDSDAGEERAVLIGSAKSRKGRPRMHIPATMSFALRANCGPRWLSGFLTMFMAFLLRENPIGDWRPEVLLGNILGITLGSMLKRVNPGLTVVLALLADAAMVLLAALFYGVVTLALLGLTAGLAQSLAKLSLDSTIQRDVPERVRTSAFARSDTTLQLAWVLGGFVGIALPLNPTLGLAVASVTLVAWVVLVLASAPHRKRRTTAQSGEDAPDSSPGLETGHAVPRKLGSASSPPRPGA